MFNFEGQVVMITGAAGNLGSAASRAFAEAGARLVLVGRTLDSLEEEFGDLAESGSAIFAAVDLFDGTAVEGMVYEAVQQLGAIDVLVNIAGGFRSGPRVHETSLDTWRFMMNLNAVTVLNTARAVVPHMLQQGSGKVVNTAARSGLTGKAKMGAYTASKGAVIRLTEAMAAELKSEGINVNCILPGTIDTPQNRSDMPNAKHERWVDPADIAPVYLFLASPSAAAIHGAAVPVYGLS